MFSSRFACPVSGFTIEEIEPRLFSFNSPHGACPACDGLGVETLLRPASGGAGRAGVAGGRGDRALERGADAVLRPDAAEHRAALQGQHADAVGASCRSGCATSCCMGAARSRSSSNTRTGCATYGVTKPFEGVLKNLQRRWFRETDSAWVREEMSRYQAEKPCAVCHGARLKPEALAVKVARLNIAEASELPIRRALGWFRRRDGDADAAAAGDRAADPARDRGAAAVPGRCRAWIT